MGLAVFLPSVHEEKGGVAMLPATTRRVSRNTSERINARIRHQAEASVNRLALAGSKEIDKRLAELDQEWDVERVVEVLAPSATLLWMTLGTRVNRKLLALAAVIQGFVLFHALQGWFPPLPILRRLGIRTSSEIDEERSALKALRGDFRQVAGPVQAIEAVRR
jgi:hypothetical protein